MKRLGPFQLVSEDGGYGMFEPFNLASIVSIVSLDKT